VDLSVNNINNSKKVSFQGMKGALNKDNKFIFKFIAPPFDSKNEKVTLEIVSLEKDAKTDEYIKPEETNIISLPFNGDMPLEISQENMKVLAETGFAYRYKIEPKKEGEKEPRYVLDTFKKIPSSDNKTYWNIIEQGRNYGVTPKTGAMYHVFVDSNAILDKNGELINAQQNKDFVRNHFNKLGGSIKGLTYLLRKTDELAPYRYIISTPDIGADPTSSHKYWPNNQYQCANMSDFKEFNYELFKQGKGYIADGAFTSQSLQSPLIQHVLKWGENSPLYNMFKIDGRLNIGVLPDLSGDDIEDIDSHIGVKLVNSPNKEGYEKDMPTYIQFFDDRLCSQAQQDSRELIDKYDIPNPKDHYDVVSHQDSVQPFAFEISPTSDKIDAFKGKNAILLKDLDSIGSFLEFPNYTISRKSQASGAAFWDGNVDIVKLNLSHADSANPKDVEGLKNARKYLYDVATFWTEAIQSDLILNTAKADDKTLDEIVENNITDKEYMDILDSIENGTYKSLVLEQNKTISEYIKDFPLQSIETSPELSAIFTQNEFKKELFEGVIFDTITALSNNIIDSLSAECVANPDYRTFVVKTLGNEIVKLLFVAAMNPNAINEDGQVDLEVLKKVSLRFLQDGKIPTTATEEREQVVDKIRENITKIPSETLNQITARLKNEISRITLNDFVCAEALVMKSRAGLNWRFDAAKDIGDLDAIRSRKANFNEIWDEVEDFWSNYIENVRKYNPSAYIISEITDLWGLRDLDSDAFDPKMLEAREKDPKRYEGIHAFEIPYAKEMQFLELSGSTTSSNYDAYFNNLSEFAGVNPEKGSDATGKAGNIESLRNSINGFAGYVQPNIAMLSHTFVDNHDKPRLLHCLPLDMALYMSDVEAENSARDGEPIVNQMKLRALKELGLSTKNADKISSKAVAVAKLMQSEINAQYGDSKEAKKLNAAVLDLMQGKKFDEKGKLLGANYRRSQAFGTLPYEVTIRDVFKNAGINDEEKIREFNYKLMENSMKLQERTWQMINAVVGTPTLFNGTEFAQTGYETPNKNVYVGNRGRIMHELKDVPGFREFYQKTQAISSLYLQPGLSAIRDGFPVVLKTVKATNEPTVEIPEKVDMGAINYFNGKIKDYSTKMGKTFNEIKAELTALKDDDTKFNAYVKKLGIDGGNGNCDRIKTNLDLMFELLNNPDNNIYLLPVFKYDENNSKTISIISNNGVPRGVKISEDAIKMVDCAVNEISLKDDTGNTPLAEGTVLKRKIYDSTRAMYVDEAREYIVKDGAIKAKDEGEIKIDDTVSTFYVVSDRNKKALYLSYIY